MLFDCCRANWKNCPGGWRRGFSSVYDIARQSRFTNLFQVNSGSGEPGMRKLLVASVVVMFGWGMLTFTTGAQEKASIKEVMKVAMKGGLTKKVASGEPTEEEKKKLAGLFAALHEN